MHSKIFQITEKKPLKENILNENTLGQGYGHYYDYCAEIDDEERKFHIANLIDNMLCRAVLFIHADGMPVRAGENALHMRSY